MLCSRRDVLSGTFYRTKNDKKNRNYGLVLFKEFGGVRLKDSNNSPWGVIRINTVTCTQIVAYTIISAMMHSKSYYFFLMIDIKCTACELVSEGRKETLNQ